MCSLRGTFLIVDVLLLSNFPLGMLAESVLLLNRFLTCLFVELLLGI
jgi:hypothetical protein